MKILANDGLSQTGIDQLTNAGFTVVTDAVAQDQLIDAINQENYVGVLVRSATTVRKEVVDACPDLKFVGRGGVGMDNIDVEYARSKGIAVFNTPGASSQSVAELVMSHMFSLARSLYDSNRQMPQNGHEKFKDLKKKYGKGTELRGKTLGIVGFGRIGQATASYALGCGMKVVTFDKNQGSNVIDLEIAGYGEISVEIPFVSLNELLKVSDIISLHVPKQTDGSPVFGDSEIAKMKDGVLIINASRGGIIDEDALLTALDSGKIGGAGLDVFMNEPTPRQDLLDHPKVSLTPHVGAATGEAQDRIGVELADQIMEVMNIDAK
jgi:D-3-phosphoglycerate dehydrogenase / 2-oxoglutarate reductase